MNSNHYKTLGLNPGATEDEIKRAYKKLALKWHPDRNTDKEKAEEEFKKISQAYQCLTNPNQNHDSINFNEFMNANDLFNQIFNANLNRSHNSNFGVNIADILSNIQNMNNPHTQNFSNFSTFGNLGGNFVSKQTQVSFKNGKRIEKIIETNNGVTTEKTIITDVNTRLN